MISNPPIRLGSRIVAETISQALRRRFGNTKSAVKEIARRTGANNRTAENWWSGECAPNAADLIALAAECDEVFEEFCRLSGRLSRADADSLVRNLDDLGQMLERVRNRDGAADRP